VYSGKKNFELNNGLCEDEVNGLVKALNEYTVKFPPREIVQLTTESLQQYVPDRRNALHRRAEKGATLLAAACRESALVSGSYWLTAALLFILGYTVTVLTQASPYATVVLLAPIPFVAGLVEVFRSRDQGMMELEAACKHSFREVILSRLLVTGIYSLLLNSSLSAAFSIAYPGTFLWQMTLLWLTPFSAVSALSLWTVIYLKGIYTANFFLALWIVTVLLLQSFPGWAGRLLSVNLPVHGAVVFAGTLLFLACLQRLTARHYTGRERWLPYGADN
jgi:hypothetical protein